MSQVTALLARQEAVNEVVDKFSKLDPQSIQWTLLQRNRPADSVTASLHRGRAYGHTEVDALEPALQRPLRALDLDPDTLAAYARGLRNGAVVIVVRLPDGSVGEIHRLLARCDATDIAVNAPSAAAPAAPAVRTAAR